MSWIHTKIVKGTIAQKIWAFLWLWLCLGCSSDGGKTQYIAIIDGKKLQPYVKVSYKISVDRQEVLYQIETPGKGWSQPYKMKKCKVKDLNNWEGEGDYILLWKIRVEIVDGVFSLPGGALANVGWFTWHFRTEPSPGLLSTIGRVAGYGTAIVIILGVLAFTAKKLQGWHWKRKGPNF
jgi:hypothetical protein